MRENGLWQETMIAINFMGDIMNEYADLVKENAALRKALEQIVKHQEIVNPSKPELSSTWQIAKRALGELDDR